MGSIRRWSARPEEATAALDAGVRPYTEGDVDPEAQLSAELAHALSEFERGEPLENAEWNHLDEGHLDEGQLDDGRPPSWPAA